MLNMYQINFAKWCPKCLHSSDDTYAIPDRCNICMARKEGYVDDQPVMFRGLDELVGKE